MKEKIIVSEGTQIEQKLNIEKKWIPKAITRNDEMNKGKEIIFCNSFEGLQLLDDLINSEGTSNEIGEVP